MDNVNLIMDKVNNFQDGGECLIPSERQGTWKDLSPKLRKAASLTGQALKANIHSNMIRCRSADSPPYYSFQQRHIIIIKHTTKTLRFIMQLY